MKQTDSKKRKLTKTSDNKTDEELLYWDEDSKSIILQFQKNETNRRLYQ